jgi:putative transposase
VWNRIPDEVRGQLIDLALEQPELSPRELAVTFTDERAYFVSEASVYRLLRAHDLITSPAFIVMKAADEFHDKTTAPNQLWQTDFTYLKVIGWGWFYLSTILDDFSRYIIAWKLCTTMRANDVTDTIEMALEASGLDERPRAHRPRLLSDNGSSYIAGDLAKWLDDQGIGHVRGAPNHPQTQGKIERWHQTLKNRILAGELLPARRPRSADRRLRQPLQSPPLPREPRQSHASRCLLRPRPDHPHETGGHQTAYFRTTPLAARQTRCLNTNTR